MKTRHFCNSSATFFACLKWIFYIGTAAWFVIMPLLPIYGALNPWPTATSAIENSGVRGTLLMIGLGGYSESGSGGKWVKQSQRTYMAVPESLVTGNVFSVTETSSSSTTGTDINLTVFRVFPWILALWLASGIFLVLLARRTRARKAIPAQGKIGSNHN